MMIRTQCKKCGVILKLDFGNMTKEEALAMAEKMDTTPRECPGMHMELGGFRQLWSLDDAIHRAYDLGEGEDAESVMTDLQYVKKLLAEGKDVIDGGQNTVPELRLPACMISRPGPYRFRVFQNTTHLLSVATAPRNSFLYTRTQSEFAGCLLPA